MAEILENPDFVYILFGQTGCGKSATGNSILGQDKYVTGDSGNSVTSEVQISSATHCGVNVCVIDTPGAMDTDDTSEQSKYRLCQQMADAVKNVPEKSKTIIILVLKYPDRFTDEIHKIIYIFKHLFGNDVIAQSCVIIFTGGDDFKQKGTPFLTWCQEQEGELKKVLRENNYKCLLFENENPDCRQIQFEELIRVSKSIMDTDCLSRFLRAEKGRRRLILESKLPVLDSSYQNKYISFENQLQVITRQITAHIDNNNDIQIFQKEIEKTLQSIEDEDDKKYIFYEKNEQQLLHPFRIRFQKLNEKLKDFLKQAARQKEKIKMEKKLLNLKSDICNANYTNNEMNIHISNFRETFTKIKKQIKEHEKGNPYLNCLKSEINSIEDALSVLEWKSKMHRFKNEMEQEFRALGDELNSFKEIPSKEKIVELQEKCLHLLEKVTDDNWKEEMKDLIKNLKVLIIRLSYLERERKIDNGWSIATNITSVVTTGLLVVPIAGAPLSLVVAVGSIISRLNHKRLFGKKMRKTIDDVLKNEEARSKDTDTDEQVKTFQVRELKRCVEQIDSSFSHEMFKHAKRNHPRLYLEAMLPSLSKKYRESILNLQSETHTIDIYNENSEEKLLALKEEVLKLNTEIMEQEEKANYLENDYSPFVNEKEEIGCLCRLLEDNITHSKMFKISNECKGKIIVLFEKTARFDMKKSDENELDKLQAILQNTMSSYKNSIESVSSTVDVTFYTTEVYEKEKQLQNKIENFKVQYKQIKVIAGFKAELTSIECSLSNIPVKETNSTVINDVCRKVANLLDKLKQEKERSKEPQVKTLLEQTEDDTENNDTLKLLDEMKEEKERSKEPQVKTLLEQTEDDTENNDTPKLLDEMKEEKERSKEPQVKTLLEQTEDDTENNDTPRDPLDELIEQVNSLQKLSLEKKEKIKSNMRLEIIGALLEFGSPLLGVPGTVAAASKPFAQGTAKVAVKVASQALISSAPVVRQTGVAISERLRINRE